jgi:hypothetical protein
MKYFRRIAAFLLSTQPFSVLAILGCMTTLKIAPEGVHIY